jgi:hypothetical protein
MHALVLTKRSVDCNMLRGIRSLRSFIAVGCREAVVCTNEQIATIHRPSPLLHSPPSECTYQFEGQVKSVKSLVRMLVPK